ncbi:class I SAM-dependent methyltransferase [Jiella pelagia]|uniref:HAMP domain-containing protein n=1 Tax=Jiella pelagia TaxID=2986949 RepID=A0ABY7BVV2_9HYPH|nr:hypothetical protein [Jiella pelagia]WAP67629.1 hypothetical protein OH818_19345 [Jiella pelagia]
MIRLAIRTLPVFAVIIGFAMILAAFLNFSGVRTAYLDLIRSRMAMTAGAIATDIAKASSLGIRLPEQTTLPDLLARQSSAEPLLLSIDVEGSEGDILFSSDPARTGTLDDIAGDTGAFRHRQDVANDFGAPVGAVVVRLDRAAIDATIDKLRVDILTAAVPAGLGAVVAGCLIALLLLTRLHRIARRASDGRAGAEPLGSAEAEMARLQTSEAA